VSAISTHVLDTALGKPAAGMPVRLEQLTGTAPAASGAIVIGRASTDQDGRVSSFGPAAVQPGTYRLVFDTAAYAGAERPGEPSFFPEVAVTFTVRDQARNYHVPLLLSPFGYSTYRGS
jgi:5-hydroxyisourate hydrolase